MSRFEKTFCVDSELAPLQGKSAYLPLYFTEPDVRLSHVHYGNARFYGVVGFDGLPHSTQIKFDGFPRHAAAMAQIGELAEARIIKESKHREALAALMYGVFDQTEFVKYLPPAAE